MLYVGLTEKHEESAVMFAKVVGGQVYSAHVAEQNGSASQRGTRILRNRRRGSWIGFRASDDGKLNEDISGSGW